MSIELYPEIILEGDLTKAADGSGVDEICTEIEAACKGFGTDEKRLLKAMGSMNGETRCKVPLRYKEMFEKDLKAVIDSECGSRDFGTALQFLAMDPVAAECDMIKQACKGAGTKKDVLYPIICGRSNKEMTILKKKYFDLYSEDLGRLLDKELGGDMEALVFTCFQAAEEAFDPDFHTEEKATEDAETLYKMGQGKWGTDEKGLFKFFCAAPPAHLLKINQIYEEKYGNSILKAFKREVGGDAGRAGLFLLGMKLKPHQEVAELIEKACKGFGTNELLLTTTLIRYQKHINEIKVAFTEVTGKSLEDTIKSETGGDYERILLEIIEV